MNVFRQLLTMSSAFNFPFQLSLGPMIGAIAGGNTVVLKPSEQASASAAVMQKIVEDYLDKSAYTVIQGGVPETQALLNEKWDKIFFTGSANVGKIIAKAAAPTRMCIQAILLSGHLSSLLLICQYGGLSTPL